MLEALPQLVGVDRCVRSPRINHNHVATKIRRNIADKVEKLLWEDN
jgi:hypothetical protein